MAQIIDNFVIVAEDCPNQSGLEPPLKEAKPSLARIQYDLLIAHPYEYDLDSFNFEVHCRYKDIAPEEREAEREAFFSKSHPCLRASPLTKQYGFGAHYNSAGRIAIYAMDSVAYAKFLKDPSLKIEKAMRNRRAA